MPAPGSSLGPHFWKLLSPRETTPELQLLQPLSLLCSPSGRCPCRTGRPLWLPGACLPPCTLPGCLWVPTSFSLAGPPHLPSPATVDGDMLISAPRNGGTWRQEWPGQSGPGSPRPGQIPTCPWLLLPSASGVFGFRCWRVGWVPGSSQG